MWIFLKLVARLLGVTRTMKNQSASGFAATSRFCGSNLNRLQWVSIDKYETQTDFWMADIHQIIVVADQHDVTSSSSDQSAGLASTYSNE